MIERKESVAEEEERTLYNSTALLVIHRKSTSAELTFLQQPMEGALLAGGCAVCAVSCTPPARFVRSGVVARGPIKIAVERWDKDTFC